MAEVLLGTLRPRRWLGTLVIACFTSCAGGTDPIDTTEGLSGIEAFTRVELDDGVAGGLRASVVLLNTGSTAREFTVAFYVPITVRLHTLSSDSLVLCEPCNVGLRAARIIRIAAGSTDSLTYVVPDNKLASLAPGNYRIRLGISAEGNPQFDAGLVALPVR